VVRRFLAAIESGTWADLHGRIPLEHARILDACYQSAHGGHEVTIEHGPIP